MATLTNCYATLEEFRQEIRVDDISDEEIHARALNAASRQIDSYCARRFWQDSTVVDRKFRADDGECVWVDDISTSTGLVVRIDDGDDGTFASTLTIDTHFVLEPLNAAVETPAWPYTRIVIVDGAGGYFPTGRRPGVQVTAKFGWPAIPDDVKKACIHQAGFLYKAGSATLGAAQFGNDGGAFFVADWHRTARALLEPYVRRDR